MNDQELNDSLRAEYLKLVPIIWTALRILGVYFVVVGAAATLEDFIEVIRRWRIDLEDLRANILFDYFFPRLFGSMVYLAAGIYLLVGGRELIEKFFLPSSAADSFSDANGELRE